MKDSIQARHRKAKAIFDSIQAIIQARDLLTWEEGKLWSKIKQEGLWKYVWGDDGERSNADSWTQFMRASGTPMSTIEMKVRLHEYWVLKWKIPLEQLREIHTRKLDRAIIPIVKGDKLILDVLDNAKVLPYDEFLLWLRDK